MDFEGKYNTRSPAVKRLMREACELFSATEDFWARPLEDNLFEWHFTVRGPPDTDFAEGVYHGRIVLPPEYPMKPPNIIILTPNGRFEVNRKICLSISGHHPETWQPSWSIRTALLALIGFMPSQGHGAVGSLDYKPEERKRLARKSREWECDVCGRIVEQVRGERASSPSTTVEEKEMLSHISLKAEENTTDQSNMALKEDAVEAKRDEEEPLETSLLSSSATSAGESENPELRQRSVSTVTVPTVSSETNRQQTVPVSSSSYSPNILVYFLVISIAFLLFRRIVLI